MGLEQYRPEKSNKNSLWFGVPLLKLSRSLNPERSSRVALFVLNVDHVDWLVFQSVRLVFRVCSLRYPGAKTGLFSHARVGTGVPHTRG